MRLTRLAAASVFVLLSAAGCGSVSSTTSPTIATTSLLTTGLGGGSTWVSTSNTTTQNTCTQFRWAISNASLTSVSGSFSATCYGNVPVAGTGSAQATVSGSTISWSGSGTASVPGNATCAIVLTGSVELNGTQIRIPYSGTTCLGPVSGTEVLGKQ
jgi:hypothetical protein